MPSGVLLPLSSIAIDGEVYTVDPAGSPTAKTDELSGITSSYTYDELYELTKVTQGGTTTESYGYDPVGNRSASLNIPSCTVNSSNELTSDSTASFNYDKKKMESLSSERPQPERGIE